MRAESKKQEKEEQDLVITMINDFLENGLTQEELKQKYETQINKQTPKYWEEKRKYIRALTGLDPKKNGGTISLF